MSGKNPSKRTPGKKGDVPKPLTEPFNFGPELLSALAYPDTTDEAKLAAINQYIKAREEKISCLFEYYKIDPSRPDGQLLLIMALAKIQFPQGFKFVPSDQKQRGNRKRRGAAEMANLWAAVTGLLDTGMTVGQAAEYIAQKLPSLCQHNAAPSVIARYNEAKLFMEKLERGDISAWDRFDLELRQIGETRFPPKI